MSESVGRGGYDIDRGAVADGVDSASPPARAIRLVSAGAGDQCPATGKPRGRDQSSPAAEGAGSAPISTRRPLRYS